MASLRGTSLNGFLDFHQTQVAFAVRPSSDAEECGKPQPTQRAASFDPIGGIEQFDLRVIVSGMQGSDQSTDAIPRESC